MMSIESGYDSLMRLKYIDESQDFSLNMSSVLSSLAVSVWEECSLGIPFT
jgi:hypothetical protein